jgi:1-phosphofructokinase/tagatose 6-phosphate kinase
MALGQRHRAVDSRNVAGGKGVNVARALKHLGEPVIATGLAGGPTGARIRELLDAEQVLHDFIEVDGDSRTNISVVDPTTGEQTELNERGPEVRSHDLERFAERLQYLAAGADFCVFAGSLPPGAPVDTYGDLISRLRGSGTPALLDTDGEPMRAGLRAQPGVVAPNTAEAEEAVGHEFTDADDLAMGLTGLLELGAEEAIITTATGCVAIAGESADRSRYEVSIDPLETVARVGSGDAFIAGYVSARRAGRTTADCLAYAVACGAESTQHLGAGQVDPAEASRLFDRVRVERIDAPIGVR